jgi:nucleoside-diphosphate-sugar epimerase
MDPPRLLVLGAGSLIGAPLLARLTAEGLRPLAVSRRLRTDVDGAEWLVADLEDPRLEERLPELEGVIALCPIWVLAGAMPALAARGARRLIAFSSTSRFTKLTSPIATERAVAQRLAEGEAEVLSRAGALGVGATLLRPTMIYAEGLDGNVSRLAALAARFGVLPLSGAARGRRQPVHAADLADAAVTALRRPETAGRVYDLPGGETLSYRAMTIRIFEALGRPPRLISAPQWLWALGLAVLKPFFPGATAAMGARMAEDLVFDDGDARRDLDWRPRDFHPAFGSTALRVRAPRAPRAP